MAADPEGTFTMTADEMYGVASVEEYAICKRRGGHTPDYSIGPNRHCRWCGVVYRFDLVELNPPKAEERS